MVNSHRWHGKTLAGGGGEWEEKEGGGGGIGEKNEIKTKRKRRIKREKEVKEEEKMQERLIYFLCSCSKLASSTDYSFFLFYLHWLYGNCSFEYKGKVGKAGGIYALAARDLEGHLCTTGPEPVVGESPIPRDDKMYIRTSTFVISQHFPGSTLTASRQVRLQHTVKNLYNVS